MQTKSMSCQRIATHLCLGGLVVALYLLSAYFLPGGKGFELLIIALGYLSLLLIGVTLLIGPLHLLRVRRNPVNIDLRRDVGIWAAITGCLHVLLVLRGRIGNSEVLLYFLRRGCCGYTPLLTVYGLSNDAGLFATLLLLLLLMLSNTLSLRLLKGKRWKLLQRLTYLLIVLAVAHTIGFQYLNVRGPVFTWGVVLLSLLILTCQGWGMSITLARRGRGRSSGERLRSGLAERIE